MRREGSRRRQAAGACRSWFKRRGQLPFRLTRRPRGGVSQQFRYLRDLPSASSEYNPQLTQRSRQRRAASEMSHELLRVYWTFLLLRARHLYECGGPAVFGRQFSWGPG
jgi:hypothetical protein